MLQLMARWQQAKRLESERRTGKPAEKPEKAGTEVCVIRAKRPERERKWEQKDFLKGEDTTDVYAAWVKGKQKQAAAFQPFLQQAACRLRPQPALGSHR